MSKVLELYFGKSQHRCAYHTKKILKIPYTYLTFRLGQIKILCQADICSFSTKKMAFPYQIYSKNKDFWVSAKNNFCPFVTLFEYYILAKPSLTFFRKGICRVLLMTSKERINWDIFWGRPQGSIKCIYHGV